MKKIVFASLIVVFVSCGVKTPYDSFRKENKENITFSFSGSSFLINSFIGDKEFKKLTKDIVGIQKYRIVILETAPSRFENKFDAFIKRDGFEEMLRISNEGSNITMFAYSEKGKLKELFFKIDDGENLIVLSAEGNNIKINNADQLNALATK